MATAVNNHTSKEILMNSSIVTTNSIRILKKKAVQFLRSMTAAVLSVTAVAVSQQVPTLQAPADLAVNRPTTINIQWSANAGDSAYQLQIDTSNVFGTMIYNDSTLTGTANVITGLKNATTYYWRVSAKDSLKNGGARSPFSAVRSFTTWNVTPTTPLLPVTLGLSGGFAILSYAGISNTGPTVINGNVGVSPLAGSYMTGFGSPNVVGTMYGVDATGPSGSVPYPAMLTVAMGDVTIAYNDAAGRTVDPIAVSGNLGGRTLYSGLYKSNGALEISAGDLTLDAQGDINAVWIFQIASNFNMTSGRQIFLTGGAKASNVFWQTGSAASIGTTAKMKGTIIAYTTITFATGASLEGRALARTAAVTLQSNVIGGTAASTVRPAVFLGTASDFRVLAGSKINSTGLTAVNGDIGVSPSTVINGFPAGTLTGVKHPGNATSLAAQTALKAAYDSTADRQVDSTILSELSGKTYTAGVYSSLLGTFGIADTLTLNGAGDASAVWIFKMNGALTTGSGSYITLINGAQWSNVFWQVGTTATLGAHSTFRGTIMAASSIVVNEGAYISGRLLARTDSVHLNTATIGGVPVVTSVGGTAAPQGFTLEQNYPNPFNPSTMIHYSIGVPSYVTLKVYNIIGTEVATLVNNRQNAGNYAVTFNAVRGNLQLSSGVYFYRLESRRNENGLGEAFTATRKLILMK